MFGMQLAGMSQSRRSNKRRREPQEGETTRASTANDRNEDSISDTDFDIAPDVLDEIVSKTSGTLNRSAKTKVSIRFVDDALFKEMGEFEKGTPLGKCLVLVNITPDMHEHIPSNTAALAAKPTLFAPTSMPDMIIKTVNPGRAAFPELEPTAAGGQVIKITAAARSPAIYRALLEVCKSLASDMNLEIDNPYGTELPTNFVHTAQLREYPNSNDGPVVMLMNGLEFLWLIHELRRKFGRNTIQSKSFTLEDGRTFFCSVLPMKHTAALQELFRDLEIPCVTKKILH